MAILHAQLKDHHLMPKSDIRRKAADDKAATDAKEAQSLADDNQKMDDLDEALKALRSDLNSYQISTERDLYQNKRRAILRIVQRLPTGFAESSHACA